MKRVRYNKIENKLVSKQMVKYNGGDTRITINTEDFTATFEDPYTETVIATLSANHLQGIKRAVRSKLEESGSVAKENRVTKGKTHEG